MSDETEKILQESITLHQKAIDEAKRKLAELEVTYSVGDRFYRNGNHANKYILIAVSSRLCSGKSAVVMLSCLFDGHGTGEIVKDWDRITKGELDLSCYTRYWDARKKVRV